MPHAVVHAEPRAWPRQAFGLRSPAGFPEGSGASPGAERMRGISPPKHPRRLLGSALFVCALSLGSACGPSEAKERAAFDQTVTVRPRVVIDGLVELSARTGGGLFVDEVVFHAPGVHIRNGQTTIADLLATDPGGHEALFFHYDAASPGGVGSAVGGERRWRLNHPGADEASDVVFSFAPLKASDAEMEALFLRFGYDLGPLNGSMAYIRGYVAVDGEDGSIKALGADFSGDPEGDPARSSASGDPEGDPKGEAKSSGDPEGDPAVPNGSGDPEGDPAVPSGEPGGQRDAEAAGAHLDPFLGRRARLSSDELVPFFLMVRAELELPIPLVELGVADLEPGEYLPIDLRVDANRLFSAERLADLDRALGRQGGGIAVLEVEGREASEIFGLDLRSIGVKVEPERKSRIRIEGDPRGP